MKHKLMSCFTFCPSTQQLQYAFLCLRVSIGLLTMLHGLPKMVSGPVGWHMLGVIFMGPLGISVLPTFWGLLGAITEFFGGIALVFGCATRIASSALTIMMTVATLWHIHNLDTYAVYSFPLTLIVIFIFFAYVGGGMYSVDSFCIKKDLEKNNTAPFYR